MFVVHTVNQLEEAVRVGAEEILVTGRLAGNVYEAYHRNNCKDNKEKIADSSKNLQSTLPIDSLVHSTGAVFWGLEALKMVTGEYSVLDSHLDTSIPSMILQRTVQH